MGCLVVLLLACTGCVQDAETVPVAQESSTGPTVADATPSPTATTPAPTKAPPEYVVEPGDSWHRIAQLVEVPVDALYAANGLAGPSRGLHPGDVVLLPTEGTSDATLAATPTGVRATPTSSSTRPPTRTPVPVPTATPVLVDLCGAPPNPWNLNFCGGELVVAPADFCRYFACIASFWRSTNGYVVQCWSGYFSHSGGRRGACSHHGGVAGPIFRP